MRGIDLHAAQHWVRDADKPCIALGAQGSFDDAHILAPCVAHENGTYTMWYCGSRGAVADRVYTLGMATSRDGLSFEKYDASPVLRLGEGSASILTPQLLRNPDGTVHRENGMLRMWFTRADLTKEGARHDLHEIRSADGMSWSKPGPIQMENAYAPTMLKDRDAYRMWYTDVSSEPWSIRHAVSGDGTHWDVVPDPVLVVDQPWENDRLFYPTVLGSDGSYFMWYGSYSCHGADALRTSLGFAVSEDGIHWKKHPRNPVFGPDSAREWETHYTTSQTVMRTPEGFLRIWYASRGRRMLDNKYLAIGTAVWRS